MFFPILNALCISLALSPVALASKSKSPLGPKQIKNFVTFGDSYTDVVLVSNGGTPWPVYVAGYADLSLFPFARAGATCSNNLTFRPFPSLFESQLPTFLAEKNNGTVKGLDGRDTIYSLWLGTNDLGVNALLTGSDTASLVDVMECMVNWVKVLYENGGRNFIFQNIIPLNDLPLYAPVSYQTKYWTAPRNTTEWSVFMKELVLSGNALSKLMLQNLAPTLHDAHIALFDSHSLFSDMFTHPAQYLNGTAPLNVTGSVHACVFQDGESTTDPGVCTIATGTDVDSFLWFNELHPSEQADRILAQEMAKVIRGQESKWSTWLS